MATSSPLEISVPMLLHKQTVPCDGILLSIYNIWTMLMMHAYLTKLKNSNTIKHETEQFLYTEQDQGILNHGSTLKKKRKSPEKL